MISDILDHADGSVLRADVVVIGSGLAGTEVARQVAARGRSVLVLESGRRAFDPAIQALNDAAMVGKPHRRYTPEAGFHGYLPEHYRGLNRVRQFGGTSHAWTGKWRAFTAGDFEAKPWVPHSDWPIGLADLRSAYAAVAEAYGLGDVFGEMEDPRLEGAKAAAGAAGLKLAIHFWEATQTRVTERFGAELDSSERIHVVLGATATGLVTDAGGERVVAARCGCREGRRVVAEGGAFVVATGGLEAPRLLLASNDRQAAGLGNAHGLVGRYYIEHPKNQAGRVAPGPALLAMAGDLQSEPRPRFALSFALDDGVLAEHGLLRHSLYLTPVYEKLRTKVRRVLTGGPAFRDGVGVVRHYRVKFATEQVPQAESRVYLGERLDALGVPELVVDWRFTELDRRSIGEACRRLQEAFASAGLGRLEFPASPMTLDETMDAAHPMGTTRMAASPREGVVDRDLRVYGTENLYVASSSVFPTGAVYSPTYTIVALAHRLGRRLAEGLGGA